MNFSLSTAVYSQTALTPDHPLVAELQLPGQWRFFTVNLTAVAPGADGTSSSHIGVVGFTVVVRVKTAARLDGGAATETSRASVSVAMQQWEHGFPLDVSQGPPGAAQQAEDGGIGRGESMHVDFNGKETKWKDMRSLQRQRCVERA